MSILLVPFALIGYFPKKRCNPNTSTIPSKLVNIFFISKKEEGDQKSQTRLSFIFIAVKLVCWATIFLL